MGPQRRRIVALIPARGGSKSIPLKNISPIAGRPLIYWAAKACSDSTALEEVFVASDSARIRACVEELALPRVRAIGRGDATATDTAGTESAMLEFAEEHAFDDIMLVQATCPLLTSAQVDGAARAYLDGGADSLLSVVRTKRFHWRDAAGGLVVPANYDPASRPLRQQWTGQLVENGALYLTSRQRLLATGCRLSGRVAAYEMPEETYWEIDSPADMEVVEQLLLRRLRQRSAVLAAASRVRLLCVDVDGTLTEASMYYGAEGERLKRFSTRDGMGLARLRQRGVRVAIVTSEDSPIAAARARKLRIPDCILGCDDKAASVAGLIEADGLDWADAAYVGDDLNDLEVLGRVGLSACPADAAEEVRRVVRYVCKRPGGRGAVREVCDLLCEARAAAAP